MRVFFSFDYKAGKAFLGMKGQPVMMDMMVTEKEGLLAFFELRLGLHDIPQSGTDRLVDYYKCVREYMEAHKDDGDNQLLASYTVSPLATSREMLKWRDALAECGWSKETPATSRRLKVLQGVEEIFAGKGYADIRMRQDAIIERLKQGKGVMKDVTFVMPFSPELLPPVLKEIFSLAEADGAQIEQLCTPEITGDNNLAKLKWLLTSQKAESIELDKGDDSVRIWNFKDNMEAEEQLAMLGKDAFDVAVQPDTKLTDNYLHMMGKPVTGSSVANSAPQIIQLFFTGVGMMARPLNIGVLLQWLYAPIHPLPGNLRYRLAGKLARKGGWLPESAEGDSDDCYHLVKDWTEGKAEAEKGQPLNKKDLKDRQLKASVFLPDFNGGSEDTLTVGKLHQFLTELAGWSRQRSAIIAEENTDDERTAQLCTLADLCDTLKSLTDNADKTARLAYSEVEKHMSCLYEPSEFVQYRAQATSRFTVASPGQVAAKADRVLWAGLHDFEPMLPATDFLTPTEEEGLRESLRLWGRDDARRLQQQTLLLPLLFCQRQLTLVTVGTMVGMANNETVNKHPMMVRIEQQVKNCKDLVNTPKIDDGAYKAVDALTDNSSGLYSEIKKTNLIQWMQEESPTSIDKLMQNPLDYTMEYIANIKDNGQSDLSNMNMTKGNVAHGVIEHLFYVDGDEGSGYAEAIKKRVEADYGDVFDKVVETKGAMLLQQENVIECRQLKEQLKDCIDHLIDIIEKNKLHVVACEKLLDGNTFGEHDNETPTMHGKADMMLAREDGQRIIFDFKWTTSKNKYQGLLEKNRSSQLAIYAELLGEETGDRSLPTAYFLMPVGRLYSTKGFESKWAEKVELAKDAVEGDIVKRIVASYRYRRNEIMEGRIEMGEGELLEKLQYCNDTEQKNLFPLKPKYDDNSRKETNGFSNYKLFKG